MSTPPPLPLAGAARAPRIVALVPCAGVGQRAGTLQPKQYAPVAGRAVVLHTLDALAAVASVEAILVVLSAGDAVLEALLPQAQRARVWCCHRGGDTRAATVAGGLAELRLRGLSDEDWVLVHDAARCLLRPAQVQALIEACLDDAVGGLLALPVADTLKRARGDRVDATVSREAMWAAQTPQMFRLGLLERALAAAGPAVTDEASAVEALGLAPRLVPGSLANFKLTWPGDFALAERLLETR